MKWPNWELMKGMTLEEKVEALLDRNIIYEDEQGNLRWTDDGSIYKEGE